MPATIHPHFIPDELAAIIAVGAAMVFAINGRMDRTDFTLLLDELTDASDGI